MDSQKSTHRVVVPPRGGLLHVVDASGYSIAGLRRLLHETAARLELVGGGIVALGFLWRGATLWHWLVAACLLALILAVEALNTAIEVLTDRLSPEWSQMAKDAKDLGSFAVGVMLVVTSIFVAIVMIGAI
ncbi:MAG: diacylglycerol kinase [Pseudotabrizicola sp.]|uniref:diacylglycerol kinase n=1 Tax=Pseudotabrizicola sp. TaxID=2939647 RepID=UPI002724DFE8|nr:diacylglycerol kinase [Pseudotabrizicola sp.]MDO8882696.1 diacylglycerol kinase [Pseudotabrizicola sp.]MDP2079721.1 diacylglycerol kinase [Pseudotabrizicola sp.]MDZ7575692.1 diacylglycerol kinase [Pseudotabrizicola sp.]